MEQDLLLQIPTTGDVKQTGGYKGHTQCTFDFCEHS
jgi:hypothetical protein